MENSTFFAVISYKLLYTDASEKPLIFGHYELVFVFKLFSLFQI